MATPTQINVAPITTSGIIPNPTDPLLGMPDWASNIQKQVTLLTQKQQEQQHQLQDLLNLIKSQQAQLEEKEQQNLQHQQEIKELKLTIQKQQEVIQELKTVSIPESQNINSAQPNEEETLDLPFPQLLSTNPQLSGTSSSIWARAKNEAPQIFRAKGDITKPIRTQRRLPPSRIFTEPSKEHLSYQMTYIPIKFRMSQSGIRTHLRDIGIRTTRILDITQPTHGVVGLLTHAAYASTLETQLKEHGITLVSFDPSSPSNIKDPKLNNLTDAQKTTIAKHLHNASCLRGLAGMQPHIRRSVAHDNFIKGYINEQQYQYHLNKITKGQVDEVLTPVTVNALLETFDKDDQDMLENNPSPSTSSISSSSNNTNKSQ